MGAVFVAYGRQSNPIPLPKADCDLMPIVVDAHQDIAYNLYTFGRDYRRSPLELRCLEVGTSTVQNAGLATIGLPDALLGRVAVVFSTLFVLPQERQKESWDVLVYKNAGEAYQLALQQMDYYQRLADECDWLRLIRTQADLDEVLASWADGTEFSQHKQGLVVLMEGADPILEPKQFEEWYERGVRIVGPAWGKTRYAGGTSEPDRLSTLGRELLEVLAGYNAVLDLSHLAEEAYFEALDLYTGQSIIASHSNPRRFCDTDRHLSDKMIRLLAERDGVMGIVLYNGFLKRGWLKTDGKGDVPLSIVIDAIDYICQLTGSAAHVGLGSDFDGGFGAESIPEGLDTVGDLLTIEPALQARGYTHEDITAILGGNMLRKLRQSLP
jgi:membrane dipeptidase